MKIDCGNLGTPGNFEIYCRNVTGVIRDGRQLTPADGYTYDPARHLLRVSFAGPTNIRLPGARSLFDPLPPAPNAGVSSAQKTAYGAE